MANQIEHLQEQIEEMLNGVLGEMEVYRLVLLGLAAHFSAAHPLGARFPTILKEQIEQAIARMPAPLGEPPEDGAKRRAMTRFRLDGFFRDLQAIAAGTSGEPEKRN